MSEVYTWGGHDGLFYFVTRREPRRPAMEWGDIDRALDGALAECALKVLVALAPRDAESLAQTIYVTLEGGESTVDAVIAVGHADQSVGWCVTDTLVAPNRSTLDVLQGEVSSALRDVDLATALMCIAAHIRRLRG
jgi:hypothetical protein